MCFWNEENWLGDVVIQGLEEGAVTAHGTGHQRLVGWKQKQDGPRCQNTLSEGCVYMLYLFLEGKMVFKLRCLFATLTVSIVLSSPFASLSLLITHLPLCTLKTHNHSCNNSTNARFNLCVCACVRKEGSEMTQVTYLITENLDLAGSSV